MILCLEPASSWLVNGKVNGSDSKFLRKQFCNLLGKSMGVGESKSQWIEAESREHFYLGFFILLWSSLVFKF